MVWPLPLIVSGELTTSWPWLSVTVVSARAASNTIVSLPLPAAHELAPASSLFAASMAWRSVQVFGVPASPGSLMKIADCALLAPSASAIAAVSGRGELASVEVTCLPSIADRQMRDLAIRAGLPRHAAPICHIGR
jgi:hypothetical protein